MKLPPPLRRLAFGAFILSAAVGSEALTLGRSQGNAFIGRALDFSVPLALDAGADPASLCLEADVSYGDIRVDANRVSARLESLAGPNGIVRVVATVPVNEPVVTVFLRAGCSQKISRRYVLLAELADPAIEFLPKAETTAPAAGAAGLPQAQRPASSVAQQASAVAVPRPADASTRSTTTPVSSGAAVPAPRRAGAGQMQATAAPVRGLARLKLDPLDLSVERDPILKISTSLGAPPEASPQRRAEAAALWQALNLGPEEVMRNDRRLQGLETNARGLRDAFQQSGASLAAMRGQLEKAQSQRTTGLILALVALLLAVAVAVAYAVRRGRFRLASGQDWWSRRDTVRQTDFAGEPANRGRAQTPVAAAAEPPLEAAIADAVSPLAKPQAKAAVASHGPRVRPAGPTDLSGFHSSQPSSLRSVQAEELHDVQQQADFFVSLGEYEQAIDLLRSHINVNPESTALPWLDLLEILHTLKRKEDYEAVREEFLGVFNTQVPSFDGYREQSEGLEAYQSALSRIVALWPAPKVLEIIEETIFRQPGQDGGEAFGLEAYRELLLLHSIGKDVISGGDSLVDCEPSHHAPASSFLHTTMQPLSAAMTEAASEHAGGLTAGLDVNLDETPGRVPGLVCEGGVDPGPPVAFHGVDLDLSEPDPQESQPKTPR